MKRGLFIGCIIVAACNIFLAAWMVLHQDLTFISDIARDMFLLQEIAEKKFVLIGPRSSVGGLFHGPLWSYLNFPAYLVGQGNPVVIGWYWIFLIIIFLITSYIIAKKLFSKEAAMIFVLLLSQYFIFHANALFNPYGALFLMPAGYFFLVRYVQTQKIKFLLFHLATIAGMIQFQLAIGLPFLLLSGLFVVVFSLKNRHPKHLFAFGIVPLLLGNFLLFDVKHDFILTNNALRHLQTSAPKTTLLWLVGDRIDYLLNRLIFLRFGPPHGQLLTISILGGFLLFQLKEKIHRTEYFVFLYFVIGFFIASLLNRWGLLDFYVFPMMPLFFLIISSFVSGKHKQLARVFVLALFGLNIIGSVNYINDLDRFIGKDQYSWKALYTMTQQAFTDADGDFGYFVYSPDIMGYGPRYAFAYASSVNTKKGYIFEKKPVTYLLIEPPAKNNQYTSESIWKLHKIHIYSEPDRVFTFQNGYKLERHMLRDEDYLPYDPGINPGLHYR